MNQIIPRTAITALLLLLSSSSYADVYINWTSLVQDEQSENTADNVKAEVEARGSEAVWSSSFSLPSELPINQSL
jgi:hypothetical protein